MVKHIVMYTLKETEDKAQAVKFIASTLEPLVGKIPGLLHLEAKEHFFHLIDTRVAGDYEV